MSDNRPAAPSSLRPRINIKPAADNDLDPIDVRQRTPQPSPVAISAASSSAPPLEVARNLPAVPAAQTEQPTAELTQSVEEAVPTSGVGESAGQTTEQAPSAALSAPAQPAANHQAANEVPTTASPRYAKSRRQEITVQLASRVAVNVRDMADEIVAIEGGTLRSVLERAVRELHSSTVGRQQ